MVGNIDGDLLARLQPMRNASDVCPINEKFLDEPSPFPL
jgi:hypothetical protein